jgi:alpha-glucan,water dikinase
VGGKSNNLKSLQGNLPQWICLPGSAALPFGIFEKVLAQEDNTAIASRYETLTGKLAEARQGMTSDMLGRLKQAILELKAPDALAASLRLAMGEAGLPWPENWEGMWTCIKKVWASKWNERAYLSRLAVGIPHQHLFMAVLIQEVVNADYSFVIHTANPFSRDRTEIFAEVVPGLGETLVGNYPGRALSFTCKKNDGKPVLRSYPSKSIALFGSSIIFRSDSNGEDLADFAGAGLYDSVMLEKPRKKLLDYTKMPLVTDDTFRENLMQHIASIGIAVENLMGVPQDVEGAYCKGKYYVVQTRPQVGLGREFLPS